MRFLKLFSKVSISIISYGLLMVRNIYAHTLWLNYLILHVVTVLKLAALLSEQVADFSISFYWPAEQIG